MSWKYPPPPTPTSKQMKVPAGPDLDRTVAEIVMLWERRQNGTDPETYGGPIYAWYQGERQVAWATDWYDWKAWSPSTRIEDAMMVVTELRVRGISTEILVNPGHIRVRLNYGELASVFADTVPLAICQAALLVKGDKT